MTSVVTKTCSICDTEKDIEEFYRHKRLPGGRMHECRECVKERKRRHYWRNPEESRKKDRQYQRKTPKDYAYYAEYREKNRIKVLARSTLNNAVIAGKIERPNVCSKCGEFSNRVEGHHEDYSKPLEVVWVCGPCHAKIHRNLGELIYSQQSESHLTSK